VSPRSPVLLAAALCGLATSAGAQIYTRLGKNGVVEATNIPDAPGFRLTYPGKGTLIHSRGFRGGTYNGEYDVHIADAASFHRVAPDLIRAVISVESEYDHLAISSKGALGLMQLMPFTARRFGVSDPFDPRQNIFGGVQYLRFLLDMFQGDVALATAAYNAGENAVVRYNGIPPFRETRSYVEKIQALFSPRIMNALVSYAAPPKPAAKTKIVPARPRIYYKWLDGKGLLHVAQEPPDEGVTYHMIRALD